MSKTLWGTSIFVTDLATRVRALFKIAGEFEGTFTDEALARTVIVRAATSVLPDFPSAKLLDAGERGAIAAAILQAAGPDLAKIGAQGHVVTIAALATDAASEAALKAAFTAP